MNRTFLMLFSMMTFSLVNCMNTETDWALTVLKEGTSQFSLNSEWQKKKMECFEDNESLIRHKRTVADDAFRWQTFFEIPIVDKQLEHAIGLAQPTTADPEVDTIELKKGLIALVFSKHDVLWLYNLKTKERAQFNDHNSSLVEGFALNNAKNEFAVCFHDQDTGQNIVDVYDLQVEKN